MRESYDAAIESSQPAIPPARRFLLVVLIIGLLGAGTDLYLLEHFEDTLQLIPLILLGLGLITIGWHVIHRGRVSVRALQILMILFVLGGLTGLVLHYLGSAEFQLEVNPELSGFELFSKAVRAKAPPALGPATLIYLGLLGLAYAYRHPLLVSSPNKRTTTGA